MSDTSLENPREPRAERPDVPPEYRPQAGAGSLLPWPHARERLELARNYWMSTVSPDARPHATPIWGVWLDDRFYFDGSPETRRGRNISANSNVVVHLESGDDVVIVHGTARQLVSPPRPLTERVAAGYREKYAASGYSPAPEQWDGGGLYEMQPRLALAWTKFPDNMTRWRFAAAD
ncbi:MAG: pyridoxamine 5'-phosphate oxidase family protein [Candidatus Promineifilaceae bacterium]|nr:pyridoxamine 5'-phosphate oxidase family protein [Candidatus Promineifilaceae bacterium]